MIGQTTSSVVPAEVDAFYDRVLIQPLRPAWIYGKYGQQKKITGSQTIRFGKYASLGTQPIALTEGVNPEPQRLSKTQFTKSLSIYGGYVEITEEVELYRIDSVVTEATVRIGWQAAETLDEITRDEIHGGDNVLYANSVSARTDIVSKIASADLRKIARAMRNNNAPHFKQLMSGSPNENTTGINNAWVMIMSPDVLFDAEALTEWVPVNEYSKPEQADEHEEGAIGPFRCVVTSIAPVALGGGGAVGSTGLKSTSTAVDVYKNLILSPDAFGCVNPESGTQQIRKDKSYGGPLNMFQTVAWKAHYCTAILEQNRMYRYECGATL